MCMSAYMCVYICMYMCMLCESVGMYVCMYVCMYSWKGPLLIETHSLLIEINLFVEITFGSFN